MLSLALWWRTIHMTRLSTKFLNIPELLHTVADLKDLMWHKMPKMLEKILTESENVVELRSKYGNCLHLSRFELPPQCSSSNNNNRYEQHYLRSTFLSMLGSVMHAGLECVMYWCMLLFSGQERNSTSYNPDYQYFKHCLSGQLHWDVVSKIDQDRSHVSDGAIDWIDAKQEEFVLPFQGPVDRSVVLWWTYFVCGFCFIVSHFLSHC